MTISDEILKRVVESYRRIRNTLRFMLANLSDFDIDKHGVAPDQWLEIDRYAVALAGQMHQDVTSHYERYEFHPVLSRLMTFCSEDMGGFYLDILKDRLYTMAPDAKARRSAQSALYEITHAFLKWIAPYLSFTAEEAWQVFAHNTASQDTIFTEEFHQPVVISDAVKLLAKWSRIREIRSDITKAIENEREAGRIGSSLQAEVEITANANDAAILQSLGNDLKFITITSQATVIVDNGSSDIKVAVAASGHQKCGRCWHYRDDVGHDPSHPELCGRCTSNLFGAGEQRQIA
jgi:isoleucyl-tRNA synthetase